MSKYSTQEILSSIWDRYSLDPFNGKLYFKNTGRLAIGTACVDRRNYRKLTATVAIQGRSVSFAYGKVVYAWVTGVWAGEGYHIDHINHDSHDNRPWNLRCVTVRENNQNRRNQKSPGIYWNTRLKKWQAQIRIQGKKTYLGLHSKESAALETYIHACDQNGYPVLPEVRERVAHLQAACL